MSFKHVPSFVWYPITCILWVTSGFAIALTIMTYRAKSLEIDLLNGRLRVQYVDNQIAIAKEKVDAVMRVVDGLTAQLSSVQLSSMPKSPPESHAQSYGATAWVGGGDYTQGISSPITADSSASSNVIAPDNHESLKIEKERLEQLQDDLKQIQVNLQAATPK